jgi:mannose-1-phosphate guanylyltransferase
MDNKYSSFEMKGEEYTDRCESCVPYRHLWSIILAGGNGDRMSDLIYRWMGRSIPKQYCAFTGSRSMLQHTLLRADRLGERSRQRTLIARAHENEARLQLADRSSKSIIIQPANRDTLPGIFLPLTDIYARDPQATVIIYPSDHFIYPLGNFTHMMERAVSAAEELPNLLVMIGARAESLELDYGWICPGEEVWRSGDFAVRTVEQFLEKPLLEHAAAARARGGLWNTMIMVVKAHTLWQLGRIHAPAILKHFERLHDVIGTSREESVLESIYETMPARNFSKDLLTPAANRIAVMPMENILWSDWGRKERVVETLNRIGKRPNFPMKLACKPKSPRSPAVELPLALRTNAAVARSLE